MFNKNEPIYIQLIDDIQSKIISKELNPGDKLPSIRDYAKEKVVNPNTVQKAFSELERKKMILSQRGIGYFVNEDVEFIKNVKKDYLEREVEKFIEKMNLLDFSKHEIIEMIKEKL